MRRLGLVMVMLGMGMLFGYSLVKAQIIVPEYWSKRCDTGEIPVECSYSTSARIGIAKNSCNKYKNDPDYRFLVREGQSLGGMEKYCFKAERTDIRGKIIFWGRKFGMNSIVLGVFTMVVETVVFVVSGFRKRKELLWVAGVNLASAAGLIGILGILPLSGYLLSVLGEIAVMVIESMVLVGTIGPGRKVKVIMTTVLANIISVGVGLAAINIIFFMS